MHALYQQKVKLYWTTLISALGRDAHKMWRSISLILKRDKDPSAPRPSLSASNLSQFFIDTMEAVRSSTADSDDPIYRPCTEGFHLTSFREYSLDEIRYVLVQSPAKTCSLDPIPTDLLLESIDIVLPVIWAMCNASLTESQLPARQNESIITPIVKKPNLDPDETKSCRPISNLSFISKVIERIVSEQVREYLTK